MFIHTLRRSHIFLPISKIISANRLFCPPIIVKYGIQCTFTGSVPFRKRRASLSFSITMQNIYPAQVFWRCTRSTSFKYESVWDASRPERFYHGRTQVGKNALQMSVLSWWRRYLPSFATHPIHNNRYIPFEVFSYVV